MLLSSLPNRAPPRFASVKSFLFLSYSLPSQDQVPVLVSSHGYKIPVVCFLHITCSYPHMAVAFSHVLAHCAAMQWNRSGNLFGLTLSQQRKKKKKVAFSEINYLIQITTSGLRCLCRRAGTALVQGSGLMHSVNDSPRHHLCLTPGQKQQMGA